MARIAKKSVTTNGVLFSFVNGTELEPMLDGLDEGIIKSLAIHGLSQKIGDSYAGAESVEEAIAAANGVWENLKAGLWGAKVQRGGKIVEALARATGQTFEACFEKWQGMDDKTQAAIRKHKDVKAALAGMEAARAAALAEAAGDSGEDLGSLFD